MLLIFCVSGCQADNPDAINTLRSMESTMKQLQPPSITLENNDYVIETKIGDYSWSKIDKKTGDITKSFSRDIDTPPGLVSIEEGTPFNLSQSITVKFKKEPNSYNINLWDNEENVGTYESFTDIKERGPYIIEIVGFWDEGEVTYVAAINIQD